MLRLHRRLKRNFPGWLRVWECCSSFQESYVDSGSFIYVCTPAQFVSVIEARVYSLQSGMEIVHCVLIACGHSFRRERHSADNNILSFEKNAIIGNVS